MPDVDDGGPAFPGQWENEDEENATAPDGQIVPSGWTVHMRGMSLRDYFAAKAMEGMYAGAGAVLPSGINPSYDAIADHCYMQADAMLKARKA